jgi:ferrous iron transport protein B
MARRRMSSDPPSSTSLHETPAVEVPATGAAGSDHGVRSARTVLLLGVPNGGKTTLFNLLCGGRTQSADYPGTSIPVGRGTVSESGMDLRLIDTPGLEGMMPDSEDERISRRILLDEGPDILALIADGRNLRKSLLLLLQVAEYAMPLVVDINLMDEVLQRGIRLDAGGLSALLGVPVTQTVATEGEGAGAFRRALVKARPASLSVAYPARIESAVSALSDLLRGSGLPSRAVALALLAGDADMRRLVGARCGDDVVDEAEAIAEAVQSSFGRPIWALILEARLRSADRLLSQVQSVSAPARMPYAGTIGEWTRRPLTGIPIAAFVVFLMYLFVGRLGAGVLTDLCQGRLFDDGIVPITRRLVAWIPSTFVQEAFVGRFGLVTVGLSGALGVVLPVLATFFFAFGVLEDSGYLPRLSVLLDRLFRVIGLNGKGVFPLVMGYSCVTMAVLTTRVLDTRRERFIATLLVLLSGPCAPLLAVMLVLLVKMSIWAWVTVFGLMAAQTLVAGMLANRILPGPRSDFILELPPLRIPKLDALIRKTLWRVWWFAKEAFPFFLLATFVLFLLEKAGMLVLFERGARPVLTGFLGLPPESVEVAIMTLIRKESGAALLRQLGEAGQFDNVQLVVSMLLLTFLLPCVNTVLVMVKERGIRATLFILGTVGSYTLALGATVNWVCRVLHVTFK